MRMQPEALLRELKTIETRLTNINKSDWHPDVKASIEAVKAQATRARESVERLRAQMFHVEHP